MLTKDQANSIADSFLTQQREEARRAQHAAGLKISIFYRCPELQALEPWQRAEVVHEAWQELRGHWGIIGIMCLWLLAFGAFWIGLVPAATRSVFHLWWYAMLALPPFVLNLAMIRLHVRYLARLRQLSS